MGSLQPCRCVDFLLPVPQVENASFVAPSITFNKYKNRRGVVTRRVLKMGGLAKKICLSEFCADLKILIVVVSI
jgi:hypothetical protein